MYKCVLFVLLLAVALPQNNLSLTPPAQSNAISHDEYEFFSAVIKSQFIKGSTKLIVIEDKTSGVGEERFEAHKMFFGERFEKLENSNGFSELENETIDDFLARPEQPQTFTKSFNLPVRYVLLSLESFQEFFKDSSRDGWEAFYKKYPNSPGIISLLRPGFNRKKNQALIYITISCGSRCMAAGYYFFIKASDGWLFKGKAIILQA